MRHLGFSTGALAKGDFTAGIRLQEELCDSVELSALRESELEPLIAAIPRLRLARFKYVSFHVPSRLERLTEHQLVDRLMTISDAVQSFIVHPDIIKNPGVWSPLGEKLALENMDQRKPGARTWAEIQHYFDVLPRARFCFDIGHARQVDPTLGVAVDLLIHFSNRLAEIHISEVDAESSHVAISATAMNSFRRIAPLIPKRIPAIIESVVGPGEIADEMKMARASLGDTAQARSGFDRSSENREVKSASRGPEHNGVESRIGE